MQKAEIQLYGVGYIVDFVELAKYPDFMLVVCMGDGEAVLFADAAFSLSDQKEIVTDRAQSEVPIGRIRSITFSKAMALLGNGLPGKNEPILNELVKLKFITKVEA